MNITTQHPVCPGDGFPLIELNGEQICSVEHADTIIGGQKIAATEIRNGYLYLVFDNGASIPLTCPCCGGKLHLKRLDPAQLGQMLSGRTVEGFRHGEWISTDEVGSSHPVFAIQFSGQEDIDARTMQVGLESVRQIAES